jgi:hypothetical protein
MLLSVHATDDATADHDSHVLVQAAEGLDDETTRQVLLHLAASLRSGFVVAAPDESVSPKVAGEMLGVSRQLVDRMIRDHQLPATTKPGSRHKLIRVSDVVALDAQRKKRHAAVDDLVSGLLEDGDEY